MTDFHGRQIQSAEIALGSKIILRCIALLVICVAGKVFRVAAQTPAQEPVKLEVGKRLERELGSGESHAYRIGLKKEQFLRVMVEQRGIDVVVTLIDSAGKKITSVNDVKGAQGAEVPFLVADSKGEYRLLIEPVEKASAKGQYVIYVSEIRPAIETDKLLQEANILWAEIDDLNRARNYNEAILKAEKAIVLLERGFGSTHSALATLLSNLAYLYRAKGDYQSAALRYERAATMFQELLGPEHPSTIMALNNLAASYFVNGEDEKALHLFQRLWALREKIWRPDQPEVTEMAYKLGWLYGKKGDYTKAIPLLELAHQAWERVLGREHPKVAGALYDLAVAYFSQKDYARAEPLFERAQTIWEATPGSGEAPLIWTHYQLAIVKVQKGNVTQAEHLFERARIAWERKLGPDHPYLANTLYQLALLQIEKHDYQKAEALLERAGAIWEKVLAAERSTAVQQVSSSQPAQDKVVNNELRETYRSLAQPFAALAVVYAEKAELEKAESLFRSALAIHEKSFQMEQVDTAIILLGLAVICAEREKKDEAQSLIQRALSIFERKNNTTHPVFALVLQAFAELRLEKSEWAEAENALQRVLAIQEKALGPEHQEVVGILVKLASAYAQKGERDKAIDYFTRALAKGERKIALGFASSSEHEKTAFMVKLLEEEDASAYELTVNANYHAVNCDLAALYILQRKGRVLDAMADSLAILRQQYEKTGVFLQQWKDTNALLSQLAFGKWPGILPEDYWKRVRELEERKELLEAEISRQSHEFREQTRPLSLDVLKTAIPENGSLVEFISLHHKSYGTKAKRYYAAYVVKPQGEVQWKDLGNAKAIDDAINAWRQALRDPQRQDVKALAHAVDEKVMQPLRPLLGNVRQVLLSPDGALNLIPFAALVDEQQQYLVNRYSFSYLTSGRDLLRFQTKRESNPESFVFADPAYGDNEAGEKALAAKRDIVKKSAEFKTEAPKLSQSVSMEKIFFGTLPGTAGEAEALKALLPQARILTKEQATEAALKQVSHPRILHIATHGFFLDDLNIPQTGARGPAQLANAARLPEVSLDGEKIENPLLRSGLALAGANLRRSGQEDGILTALEVAGLDLWGTKLVVLSACDTGVGEVKNGEGVYGLRRALVLAGSETQVMSLWPVSDMATRDLMVDYYRRLQRGEGRGEALRQVQLQMLRNPKRQHPYYWASFIQSGEWASLEGKR